MERLFSRCGLVTDSKTRNRLRVDSMAEEVLVRLNAGVLSRTASYMGLGSFEVQSDDDGEAD